MRQTKVIINTLKILLKQNSVTYLDVAEALHLSEANIKQMFSTYRLSLERLERICDLIGLEVGDFMHEVARREPRLTGLSFDQEKLLVSNPHLLLVAVSVLNRLDANKIVETYTVSHKQCQQLLLRLEEFGLLKFRSDRTFKLLIDRTFKWIPDGPIQKYFRKSLQTEFFNSSFSQEDESLVLIPGVLSTQSRILLIQRMRKLAEEFELLDQEDAEHPQRARTGSAMILAIRPWQLNVFNEMLR